MRDKKSQKKKMSAILFVEKLKHGIPKRHKEEDLQMEVINKHV